MSLTSHLLLALVFLQSWQVDGRSLPKGNFKLNRELRGFVFSTLSSAEQSSKPFLLGVSDYYKAKKGKNPLNEEENSEIQQNLENDPDNARDKKMAFALASAMLLASKPKTVSIQASIESFLGLKEDDENPSTIEQTIKLANAIYDCRSPTLASFLRKCTPSRMPNKNQLVVTKEGGGLTCTTSACGICNATPEGLTIGSPDYPSDYGNNRNCQYYITAPAGMITTISFTTFTVEKDYDYVSVYEQTSKGLRTIELTGYQIPQMITIKQNSFNITFKTDEDNQALPNGQVGKWEANLRINTITQSTTSTTTTTQTTQSTSSEAPSTITDASTTVTDASSTVSDASSTVSDASSTVSDASSTVSDTSSTVTDTSSTVTDTSSTVTDASSTVTDASSTVSDASSTVTDTSSTVTDASSTVTDTSSTVTDASSTVTDTSSTVTDTSSTVTDASSTVTSASSTVTDASTIVTNAPSTTSTQAPSSTTVPPVSGVICTSSCGTSLSCNNFTSHGGKIHSPGYPGDYGNNRNCNITVVAPLGAKIQLKFTTFYVEQDYDFISVYDSRPTPLRANLTGYTNPVPFIIKTNQVTIIFKSDGDNSAFPGEQTASWEAELEILPPLFSIKEFESSNYSIRADSIPTTMVLSSENGIVCTATPCGSCADLTKSGGFIRSPNFPNNYGNHRNCTYTIEVPRRSTMTLDFPTFVLEQDYDFISVYDSTLTPLRYKETGYVSPATITTKTNRLMIKFTTDYNNYGIFHEGGGKWEGKFVVT